jgi:hypothetical protein
MKNVLFLSLLVISHLFYGYDTRGQEINGDNITRYTYESLSIYQRSLLNGFIESMFPQEVQVQEILTGQVSIRSTTRLASALLFRNETADRKNAIEIIKWVLKHQHQEEDTKIYGMWKTSVMNDGQDQNWREFIGCDLIVIFENYKNVLSADLLLDIKSSLIHAAKGALIRDVQAEYTNISIMSSFLMHYVGTEFGIEHLEIAGLNKAREIYDLFHQYKTFSEYNSPTYDGVSLISLSLWRELAKGEMKIMGAILENSLWQEIATHYNPILKNMAGPYFRSYGMDMSKYYSITGIVMAVALNDENLAPLPKGKAPRYLEISNISPLLHLGIQVPENTFQHLHKNSSDRFLERFITNQYFAGDSLKRITASIQSDWMMGGIWGNRRVWNQTYTGTIHWKNSGGEIGWLLVPGDGKTNVQVSNTKMLIYNGEDGNPKFRRSDFSIYIFSHDLSEQNFSEDIWTLGNMKLHITTSLERTYTKIMDSSILRTECALSENYPAVMKITFQVPRIWGREIPLLEIDPEYLKE